MLSRKTYVAFGADEMDRLPGSSWVRAEWSEIEHLRQTLTQLAQAYIDARDYRPSGARCPQTTK